MPRQVRAWWPARSRTAPAIAVSASEKPPPGRAASTASASSTVGMNFSALTWAELTTVWAMRALPFSWARSFRSCIRPSAIIRYSRP